MGLHDDARAAAEREAVETVVKTVEYAEQAEAEGKPVTYEFAPTPAPDVMESPIAAELDVAVHVAWSRVMGEVQWVGKAASKGLNYQFRGIDAVLDAVGPALRKHGVMVLPIKVTPEYTVVTSKSGAVMNYCRAVCRYVVVGPRGDVLTMPDELGGSRPVPLVMESLGEAFDTGDKASTKAQSVALRELYIKSLAIPVREPARDPEHGVQHEMGRHRPSPAQYAAEIQADGTSLDRLRQIKAELYGDRELGGTEVELLDDRRVRLVDLVREVGQRRLQGGGQ